MKKQIYFDLDGILRDLHTGVTGTSPYKIYNWEWTNDDGMGFLDVVNNDLSLLLTAKPTKFFKAIMECTENLVILSHQAKEWRSNTTQWIYNNICIPYDKRVNIIYVDSPKEKLNFVENKHTILIDDYPFFERYTHVFLVCYPYNKHVKTCLGKIKTKQDMYNIINKFNKGD
jgi:hypothetical protein